MEQHLHETQEKNDSKVLYPAKLCLSTYKQFEYTNEPFLRKPLEMNFGQLSEDITIKWCAVRIQYIYLYNQDIIKGGDYSDTPKGRYFGLAM